MCEEARSEMKFQGDEEGERVMTGILISLFMGGLFWLGAVYLLYVWFVA